jgi:hypothetical protein
MPKFHPWGDGWSFGWLTGRDNDLICVTRLLSESNATQANWVLSPVCGNRLLAFLAFALKATTVILDRNVQAALRPATSPSTPASA